MQVQGKKERKRFNYRRQILLVSMPVAAFSHYFVQNNGLHGLFFPLGQRENECIILLSGTLGNVQFSLNSYSSTVGTLGIMGQRGNEEEDNLSHEMYFCK